jgi:hypothetical protein
MDASALASDGEAMGIVRMLLAVESVRGSLKPEQYNTFHSWFMSCQPAMISKILVKLATCNDQMVESMGCAETIFNFSSLNKIRNVEEMKQCSYQQKGKGLSMFAHEQSERCLPGSPEHKKWVEGSFVHDWSQEHVAELLGKANEESPPQFSLEG